MMSNLVQIYPLQSLGNEWVYGTRISNDQYQSHHRGGEMLRKFHLSVTRSLLSHSTRNSPRILQSLPIHLARALHHPVPRTQILTEKLETRQREVAAKSEADGTPRNHFKQKKSKKIASDRLDSRVTIILSSFLTSLISHRKRLKCVGWTKKITVPSDRDR